MKVLLKCPIKLNDSLSAVQTESYLSVVSFNNLKQRIQTIYYSKLEKIELNKDINLSKYSDKYIGIILIKKSKIDRQYYQFPIILIDTDFFDKDIIVDIHPDIIYRVPFGNIFKRKLEYEDFEKHALVRDYIIETQYLSIDDDLINRLITEEDNKFIVLDF